MVRAWWYAVTWRWRCGLFLKHGQTIAGECKRRLGHRGKHSYIDRGRRQG